MALRNANRMGTPAQGGPATGTGTATEGSAALDSRPSAWARSALGNHLVSASLSGEALGGLGGFLASEHAFEAAGMESEALTSNAAMLRVMRDNISLAPMDERALQQAESSSGRPLPAMHLERMETAFEHDFGHVRIHADGNAARASQALHAYAFALGADVFFGPGAYAPGTPAGDRLLAHELTHVVQHDEGRLPSGGGSGEGQEVSNPSDPHEQEAYANEGKIVDKLRDIDGGVAPDTEPELEGEALQDEQAAEEEEQQAVEEEEEEQILAAPDTEVEAELADGDGGDPAGDAPADAAPADAAAVDANPVDASASDPAAMRNAAPAPAAPQAQAPPGETPPAGGLAERVLESKGTALPEQAVRNVTKLMGNEIPNVVIHSDSVAAEVGDEVGQAAYSIGHHIFFRDSPNSPDGKLLLAHELAHVVQQAATGEEADLAGKLDQAMNAEAEAESKGESKGEPAAGGEEAQGAPAAPPPPAGTAEAAPPTPANADKGVDAPTDVLPGVTGEAHTADLTKRAPGIEDLINEADNFVVQNQAASGSSGGKAMRDAASNADSVDLYDAEESIRDSQGMQLPLAVARRLSARLGADFSKVRIHTDAAAARAAQALSANAFALGADIFFAPGAYAPGTAAGDRRLAEELHHTVQFDAGRLPTQGDDLAVSSPTDSAEVEAREVADRAVADLAIPMAEGVPDTGMTAPMADADVSMSVELGPTIDAPDVGAALDAGAVAHRDADTQDSSAETGLGLPESVTLNLAGQRIEVQIPVNEDLEVERELEIDVTLSVPDPVTGVHLIRARLAFTQDFSLDQGTVSAEITIGDVISIPDAVLRVTGDGEVTAELTDVAYQFGASEDGAAVIDGTMDLTIGSDGITGHTVATFGEISLSENVTLEGGEITLDLDAEGKFTGNGTLSGTYDELGTFELEAELGEELSGKATLDLTDPIELEELGITITELHMEGEFTGYKLETVKGSMRATVDYEEQDTFDVKGEELEYQVEDGKFSGSATATTMRMLMFGDEGATRVEIAEEASATGVVEESKLTKVDGGLDFTVQESEGQLGEGTVKLEWSDEGLNAEGDFKLTTQFGLPDRKVGPLYINEDSELNVKITGGDPDVATLENVTFDLKRPDEGEGLIQGTVEGTYTFDGDKIDGEGTAEMVEQWPYEYDWGKLTFKEGGEADVKVVESEYETIELKVPYQVDVTQGTKFSVAGEVDGAISGEDDSFTGSIDGSLVDNVDIELGKDGSKLQVLADTSVEAEIEQNELDTLSFDLAAKYYDGEGRFMLEGEISDGTYEMGDGEGKLSAAGKLTLVETVAHKGEGSDMEAKLMAGAELDVKVVENELEEIGGSAVFQVHDKEGMLLDGHVKDAKIDTTGEEWKVSAGLDVATSRDLDFPRKSGKDAPEAETGTAFSLRVLEDSGVEGTITDSKLESVTGDLKFEVHEGEGGKLAEGELNGAWKLEEDKFTGAGDLELTRNYALHESDPGEGRLEGWSVELTKTSNVKAQMTDNHLDKATVDVGAEFKKSSELIAKGNINGEYALGQSEGYSGKAGVELVKAIEWADDGRFTYELVPPTKVEAQAEESSLTTAEGAFVINASEDGKAVVELKADAEYTPGSGVTADAKVKVLDDILITDKGDWKLFLAKDSGGDASVKEDKLENVGGTIKLRADKGGVPKFGGEFTANYQISEGENASITATGNVEVLDDIKGLEGDEYSLVVEQGTKAGGSIKDGELEWVDGTLKARVDDPEPFVKIEAEGKYTGGEEPSVDVSGQAITVKPKLLVESPAKITLQDKAEGHFVVEKNELIEVGGGVKIMVADDKGDLVLGELEGKWTKAAGTSGYARGTIQREIEMGKGGEYSFFVEEGGKGDIHMEKSSVTKVAGDIDIRVDDKIDKFMKGNLNGSYDFAGKDGFTGGGSAEVLREKQLGEAFKQTLWVMPSSGARIEVAKNEITKLEGDVLLSLRDDKGEYVQVEFAGSYDVGKSAFSGGGKAEVTREKKLFGEDSGYSFWLKEGAGAEADVEANKLTHVGGKVPFMVKDGKPEPLIEGSAQGDFYPETGKFSGKGEVYLGRDVEYELGVGKLVFKRGSGGSGEVVESKLNKLGGKLDVDVWDGDGKLLNVKAEGEFDAVKSKIIWVEGEASLLRPMEPLGEDILIIESLTGRARVEDNELKWAEGHGAFTIVPLNNMKGTIDAKYENRGGTEIYTGKGKLEFTLFDEPDKGRYMKGEVDAELLEGDKFKVKGTALYGLNEMISGDVTVEMDEKMDPSIGASMTITKELVAAQDIFSMDMPLIPHTTVPIYGPIAMFFGASAGMSLSTLPLNMTTTIGISNWHPLARESNVPDFDAELALNWGLDFEAMLAAYLSIGLTAGVGSASAGIRGEVRLDAPLRINPSGKLHGGADGFWGELGIGIKLEPTIQLAAIPFVEARLTGFDPIQHDFDEIATDFGPIFSFEWGTTYRFGDVEEQRENPTADAGAPPASSSPVEHSEEPETPPTQMGTPTQSPGGPQLESGSDVAGDSASDRASEGGSEMDELMEKIDQVTILAEGLGAAGYLLGLLIDVIMALSIAGPVGLVIMLAWKIACGDLTWDGLVEAVENLVEAVQLAAELLRPYLPDWVNGVIDFFSGEAPSLIDAFFGADDKIREEVDKGSHLEFPATERAEMTAGFIQTMMDGYCGDADEDRILVLLRYAESNGFLTGLPPYLDGSDPWHELDYKLDGSQNREFNRIMDRNGIDFESSWL